MSLLKLVVINVRPYYQVLLWLCILHSQWFATAIWLTSWAISFQLLQLWLWWCHHDFANPFFTCLKIIFGTVLDIGKSLIFYVFLCVACWSSYKVTTSWIFCEISSFLQTVTRNLLWKLLRTNIMYVGVACFDVSLIIIHIELWVGIRYWLTSLHWHHAKDNLYLSIC